MGEFRCNEDLCVELAETIATQFNDDDPETVEAVVLGFACGFYFGQVDARLGADEARSQLKSRVDAYLASCR